ncbi:adenylate/guanylate cyclase domain-containing protein [Ruficoccus amylovorans]|uniref:Adenylate/guanylate cyclase domain-containing protein n=1 Tax=Ruficoccus amylovorans TaxID=1804625 RepID=A0A842H9A2_9BACT|nr:adenylate/guanylate cyclase domain-containing protein [Ruficoccus amylovorans]MBC2592900.1 adenylate/guanylate cyclase domain-containing protein [Ruficoccus amylovorans]
MASARASNFKLFLVMAPVALLWLALSEWEPLQPVFKPLENLAMDWRFQIRGEREVPEARLVYANVDAATSDYWGERPFPRGEYARLARVLFEYGEARAVGFDFVLSPQAHSVMVPRETIIEQDKLMALLTRLHPETVYAAFYSGSLLPLTIEDRKKDRSVEYVEEKPRNFPYLRENPEAGTEDTFPEMPAYPIVPGLGEGRVGLIDMDQIRNAGPVQRWIPLFSRSRGPYETLNHVDGIYASLGIDKNEAREFVDELDGKVFVFDRDYNQLGVFPTRTERTFYTLSLELALIELGLERDAISIDEDSLQVTDAEGEVLIDAPLTDGQVVETNWFSRWDNRELNPAASARKIYEQAYNLEESGDEQLEREAREFFKMFKDAVVLIGPTDPLLQDLAPTPFDSNPVPKVSVHGNLYKTLMSGQYITRLPRWADVVILCALTALVAWLGTYSGRSSLWAKLASFAVLVLYVGGVFWAFSQFGLVVPLVAPVACAVTTTTAGAIYRLLVEEKQKGRIKGMFGTYLSPQLVERMVESGEEPQLGGVDETITAFFSDIQSFSSFSELLEPHQLVELMNEYLTAMTDIVQEEGGTLDKYIGDAMVAMFNAPIHIEHHAYKACRAAARIQQRQAILCRKWAGEGDKWPPIVPQMRTRIGLNTGHATVGNMGSETRFNYTMMGDTVNLAARCESGAKSAGAFTLVTEQTRREALAVRDDLLFRFVDKWQVKGRAQPVDMYELVGFREELSPEVVEAVGIYEAALQRYFACDWDGARADFEKAAQGEQFQPGRDPGVFLNPSLAMIARCAQMKANPPPAGWDGVYVMKTK